MFTVEEFEVLVALAYARDADALTDWFRSHIIGPADCTQVLVASAVLIGDLIPRLGSSPEPGEYWGLEVDPGASDAARLAGQVIAAALNGDQAMTGTLARAIADHPNEETVGVALVRVTVILGDVLHALAEKHTGHGNNRM